MELHEYSFEMGVNLEIFQSNFEGEIIEKIQYALGNFDGIILNAGAFTHTSIAIRDALTSVKIPTVEVHISNIYKRKNLDITQCLLMFVLVRLPVSKLIVINWGFKDWSTF